MLCTSNAIDVKKDVDILPIGSERSFGVLMYIALNLNFSSDKLAEVITRDKSFSRFRGKLARMPESTASLRDLYSKPPDIWSFPVMKSGVSNGVSSTSQWPSQSRQPHPLFDLTSQQSEQDGLLISVTLKGIFASALLQYSTAAVAMPWEVGKLLLQIQYLPRIRREHDHHSQLHEKTESDDAEVGAIVHIKS
jgi:hypothetical protein